VSGEAILSVENSYKSLGGQGSARTLLGSSHCFPDPLAGGACCPALGLRFRFSALSQQSSFPPMRFRKGLDKNTGSAHFWNQRMHQNTGFCIKYTKKIATKKIATPGPPRRKGRHLFAPTPLPTRQMMVPLRFFWAGYGPGGQHLHFYAYICMLNY